MVLLAGLFASSCAGPRVGHQGKIRFNVEEIDDRGLIGPPDGLASVAYEFCIPEGDAYTRQVMLVDPSVRFYPGSRGRIGCERKKVLCIGSTGKPNWRGRLLELSALDYVTEIRRSFFE